MTPRRAFLHRLALSAGLGPGLAAFAALSALGAVGWMFLLNGLPMLYHPTLKSPRFARATDAIVAAHMGIDVRDDSPLDEAQFVYLADKLVEGKTVVSLARRFDAKLRKFGHDSQVAAHIIRRKQAARMIQGKIERISGMTMDQLLEKAAILLEDGHEPHV